MLKFLWDQCDHTAQHTKGLGRANFVLCAWLLSVFGDDYWRDSHDWKGV